MRYFRRIAQNARKLLATAIQHAAQHAENDATSPHAIQKHAACLACQIANALLSTVGATQQTATWIAKIDHSVISTVLQQQLASTSVQSLGSVTQDLGSLLTCIMVSVGTATVLKAFVVALRDAKKIANDAYSCIAMQVMIVINIAAQRRRVLCTGCLVMRQQANR